MHCEIFYVKHWNIKERCNKLRLSCIWSHFTAFAELWVHGNRLTLSLLAARGNFCHLLISFANSLDPDQDRHNVCPDLDPNCLTTRLYS